jgi:hypothetical protein
MEAPSVDAPFAVACSLTASERQQRGQDFEHLLAGAEDVEELAEGYALKFPGTTSWVMSAAELIVAERACCPFFSFALTFEPNGGSVWLHITGPDDVKEGIWQGMVPGHLRLAV